VSQNARDQFDRKVVQRQPRDDCIVGAVDRQLLDRHVVDLHSRGDSLPGGLRLKPLLQRGDKAFIELDDVERVARAKLMNDGVGDDAGAGTDL
jgi:hypothetical protein